MGQLEKQGAGVSIMAMKYDYLRRDEFANQKSPALGDEEDLFEGFGQRTCLRETLGAYCQFIAN